MAVVIAVDAGTTGVRAFAVDEDGRPFGWSYREFPQHFPRPGWMEHDPDDIWHAVQETLAELVALCVDRRASVAAIGITNQRETVVAWDRRTGRPLHRAIVWQDRRTAASCQRRFEDGSLPLVRRLTGLVLDPYFSASKVEWLLGPGGVEAGPDLALGTVDSWVLWNLSGGSAGAGVHATDPSNASRTMLWDIRRRCWSPELCELFGVPAASLPEVLPSSGRFATTAESATALGAGVPIGSVVGDQQAALFGQACFTPGMAKNTYGTGSFVLMNVGTECPEPVEGLLSTVAWSLGHDDITYALEGAIFSTGATIQWLRDGLGALGDAGESESLARSLNDSEGVYLVPAFAGLGSPWWDPWARGLLVGLTRGTGRAHLARAALEAMAYQTRDVIEAMQDVAGRPVPELRVDGGASANNLLLQLQADQLRIPVRRPVVQETTALGAALLAGLAEGVWSSLDETSSRWTLDAEFAPELPASVADSRFAGWRRALERSRGWADPDWSG
ncbi:MAG: glycerol kinase GlpK [Acidimicrobiales bacterium]